MPVLRLSEANDFVPEHCVYSDEGCDLFPSCLRCPLPECRYDQPGRHARKELRNEAIARLHCGGMPVRELARRFGVSTRTVYRATTRRSYRHKARGRYSRLPATTSAPGGRK